MKGSLHEGMSRKRLPGDSGARPSKGSVDQDTTRSAVPKVTVPGGRVA